MSSRKRIGLAAVLCASTVPLGEAPAQAGSPGEAEGTTIRGGHSGLWFSPG